MSHPLDPLRRALDAKYNAMRPAERAEFDKAVARRVAAMRRASEQPEQSDAGLDSVVHPPLPEEKL